MYIQKISENHKVAISSIVILMAFAFAYAKYMIKFYDNYNFTICKVDLILDILNKENIGLLLSFVPALFSLYMTKYDFNCNLILRYKDKRFIWLRQNAHIIFNNLIVLCFVVGLNYLVGAVAGKPTYNWNSEDSLFVRKSNGILLADQQYNVIITTIVVGTLIISIISILCNLIYWLTDSSVIAYLTITSYCLFCVIKGNFNLSIFYELKINEIDFITGNRVILKILYLFMIIVLLIFFPLILIKKKEFYPKGVI